MSQSDKCDLCRCESPVHGYPSCYVEKLESRIAELESAQRWIPCSERMPDESDWVLAYGREGRTDPGRCKQSRIVKRPKGDWWVGFDIVTHWLPLPQPPEGAL